MEIDTIIYETPMRLIVTTFNKITTYLYGGDIGEWFLVYSDFLGLLIERSKHFLEPHLKLLKNTNS